MHGEAQLDDDGSNWLVEPHQQWYYVQSNLSMMKCHWTNKLTCASGLIINSVIDFLHSISLLCQTPWRHSKSAFAFCPRTGFWLIRSMPRHCQDCIQARSGQQTHCWVTLWVAVVKFSRISLCFNFFYIDFRNDIESSPQWVEDFGVHWPLSCHLFSTNYTT